MEHCENCGNTYSKVFMVNINDQSHTFDCFECAIQSLAPTCSNCHTKIIGHGVESDDQIFCCAHCARALGKTNLQDNATRAQM
jgi:hypothetical protein